MNKLKELLKKKLSLRTVKNFLLVLMVVVPFLTFWIGVFAANFIGNDSGKNARALATPTVKPTRKISPQDIVAVSENLNNNPTDRYVIFQERNSLKILPPNSTNNIITLENTSDNFTYDASISSDNKTIVYLKNSGYNNGGQVKDNNIYIYNTSTKQKKAINIGVLQDNSTVTLSPLGDYLVLTSNYGASNVYTVNINNPKDVRNFYGRFISFVDDYNYLYAAENYDYTVTGTTSIIAQRDIRKTFSQLYKESPNSPLLVQENNKKYTIYNVDKVSKTIYYSSADMNDPYNQNTTVYYQIGFDGKNKKQLDKFPEFVTNKDLTDKLSKVLDTNIEYFPEPSIIEIIPDSKNANKVIFSAIGNGAEYSSTGNTAIYSIDLSNTGAGIQVLYKEINRVVDYSK